jgi:phosphatidylglycerophosphate synthase
MDKVPIEYAFWDLSDYARGPARWLAERVPGFITPIHLTLAFLVAGAGAAWLLAINQYLPLAAGLLVLKSMLDAADGSLARLRQTPSRVGRFLDSVCDFLVTVLVVGGIGFNEWQSHPDDLGIWLLVILAALSVTVQCSVFSFYYVTYRSQTGGDQTSQVQETRAGYANDNPTALAILFSLYRLIYSWQDRLIGTIDKRLAGEWPLQSDFLTATSVLGLGAQLLVLAVCALVGQPMWALFLFIGPFNLYMLGLFGLRYATRLWAKH